MTDIEDIGAQQETIMKGVISILSEQSSTYKSKVPLMCAPYPADFFGRDKDVHIPADFLPHAGHFTYVDPSSDEQKRVDEAILRAAYPKRNGKNSGSSANKDKDKKAPKKRENSSSSAFVFTRASPDRLNGVKFEVGGKRQSIEKYNEMKKLWYDNTDPNKGDFQEPIPGILAPYGIGGKYANSDEEKEAKKAIELKQFTSKFSDETHETVREQFELYQEENGEVNEADKANVIRTLYDTAYGAQLEHEYSEMKLSLGKHAGLYDSPDDKKTVSAVIDTAADIQFYWACQESIKHFLFADFDRALKFWLYPDQSKVEEDLRVNLSDIRKAQFKKDVYSRSLNISNVSDWSKLGIEHPIDGWTLPEPKKEGDAIPDGQPTLKFQFNPATLEIVFARGYRYVLDDNGYAIDLVIQEMGKLDYRSLLHKSFRLIGTATFQGAWNAMGKWGDRFVLNKVIAFANPRRQKIAKEEKAAGGVSTETVDYTQELLAVNVRKRGPGSVASDTKSVMSSATKSARSVAISAPTASSSVSAKPERKADFVAPAAAPQKQQQPQQEQEEFPPASQQPQEEEEEEEETDSFLN